MSTKIVECPICESAIVVSQFTNSEPVECQVCKNQIPAWQLAEHHSANNSKTDNAKAISPESLVSFDRSALPFSNTKAPLIEQSTNPVSKNDNPATSRDLIDQPERFAFETNGRTSVYKEIVTRKRAIDLRFMISNLVLIFLIILAGSLFVWQWNRTSPGTEQNPIEPIADRPESPSKTSEIKPPIQNRLPAEITAIDSSEPPDQTPSEIEPVDETSGQSNVEPPKPTFTFHTPKQVRDAWKIAKPNLLSLEIEGPFGKQRAIGTIIDSRGWIVTSYHAVKDAWRIEATAATNPLDQPATDQPLIDLVRGHVISDPSRDIAILAVNRRFVVSLGELEIGHTNRIVQESRLLAAAPPTETSPYGMTEVKVDRRASSEELPDDIQAKIKALEINAPGLIWFSLRTESEWLPGTPVFDEAGRLQAMVSFSKGKVAQAVPLISIRELASKASARLTPLKSPLVQLETGESALIDPAVQAQMIELNRLGTICEEFEWLPGNLPSYRQLADFMAVYLKQRSDLLNQKENYRDSAETRVARQSMQSLLDDWEKKFLAQMEPAIANSDPGIQALNQFAEKELGKKKTARVPFFGRVYEGGAFMDQTLVQLDQSESFVYFAFDPEQQVLRPGSYWLMLVEMDAESNTKRFRINPTTTITAISVKRSGEIGPFLKE